jgi:hypothetical protein
MPLFDSVDDEVEAELELAGIGDLFSEKTGAYLTSISSWK